MTDKPQRKPNRLAGFDYSTPRAYFVTICVKDKQCLLGTIVGAAISRPPSNTLTQAGRIVDAAIRSISSHYPSVSVEKYVVMPNHVHILLMISSAADGRLIAAPTNTVGSKMPSISQVVGHMKRSVSKTLGVPLWQKSFHDHIIRNEDDYRAIWEYIDTNPFRWTEDCFFQP